jgi:hypothetical protein
MPERRKYVKRAGANVVAVQLNLETDGFSYHKWGESQRCKPGDWIVDNAGEIYTVDRDAFERTYRPVAPGTYAKVSAVWAEVAREAGVIKTMQGLAHYQAGAYLVYNDTTTHDAYPVEQSRFEKMYELAP